MNLARLRHRPAAMALYLHLSQSSRRCVVTNREKLAAATGFHCLDTITDAMKILAHERLISYKVRTTNRNGFTRNRYYQISLRKKDSTPLYGQGRSLGKKDSDPVYQKHASLRKKDSGNGTLLRERADGCATAPPPPKNKLTQAEIDAVFSRPSNGAKP